ncbi:MAG: hypothetical protein HY342_11535 [Candidatus Lambdaproteobacteria bacterium]|nr:hypothetical protein [Candidatus Lambdaproteobacteria bacterium]
MPTVLATGDLRGEIKPCGCSPEGQFGGLPRLLTFVQQTRGASPQPVLVNLGNNFPAPSDQGRLKVELTQTVLRALPPDAILPGPNELALGAEALDAALPYVASNDRVGRVFRPRVQVRRAGRTIGIYGYLSPSLVYQGSQTRFALEPVTPAWLQRLRAESDAAGDELRLLLFRGNDEELAILADAQVFTRIVGGNPFDDELHQVLTRQVGAQTVAQVPTKGQGVLRMPLGVGPAQVEWLGERYADHPRAVAAMSVYDEQVKQLFFRQMEQLQRAQSAAVFAGVATCEPCHKPIVQLWSASGHARAHAVLVGAGKQFDPECLACHVVGLGSGGYINQTVTPQLANVQCENCHGPGIAHNGNPAAVKPRPAVPAAQNPLRPGEATCRTCHRGSHSPKFDFPTYWAKIKH